MQSAVFWDVAPNNAAKVHRYFGETYVSILLLVSCQLFASLAFWP
jgi:hypothetical protein